MTSIPINAVAEPYIRLRAMKHLEKGYLVIFAGGNGQPYVTTDYPAVQRALEMGCDAILAAKQGVDGVYDRDPNRAPGARRYRTLNYRDVIARDLKVMDQTAFLLARDHRMPVHIFDFDCKGAMRTLCEGGETGTIVGGMDSMLEGGGET
ncbi:uridylate kinase [Melghirimyces profundicolus]|uniref:UMP kinase n=1 Tax=Melghirimyces profundicolus TaxID=1242148 RepID=A0A2T6C4U7_9BACL|nr:uridylate kinase [Melghirimyces profundicolus]